MVEGDDLDQPPAQGTVEESVRLDALDADEFHGQVDRFVVLDVQVVVVDAVDAEGERHRGRGDFRSLRNFL